MFPQSSWQGLWKEEGGAGELGPLQKEARLLAGMRPTCRVGWQWRQEGSRQVIEVLCFNPRHALWLLPFTAPLTPLPA